VGKHVTFTLYLLKGIGATTEAASVHADVWDGDWWLNLCGLRYVCVPFRKGMPRRVEPSLSVKVPPCIAL
jgi:hypothetical protein